MDIKIEIKIPAIPNYIVISDSAKVPISKLNESELREIGALWTEELVRIAREGNSIR